MTLCAYALVLALIIIASLLIGDEVHARKELTLVMALELTTDQKVSLVVTALTAAGNPTKVPEPVVWDSSSPAVVAVTPDPTDDTKATATAVNGEGSATVTATAGTLSASIDVTVTAAAAASLAIVAGTPEPK